jgi:hypothetical protein
MTSSCGGSEKCARADCPPPPAAATEPDGDIYASVQVLYHEGSNTCTPRSAELWPLRGELMQYPAEASL